MFMHKSPKIKKQSPGAELSEAFLGSLLEAASRRPLEPPTHDEQKNLASFFINFCISCRLRFAQQIKFTAKLHAICCELYLPSFGNVKMLTQYAHIAWGSCLEVRR